MIFKIFVVESETSVLSHLQQSLSPLNLHKTIKFSSQTNSPTWVHHNQLFQRHPRLQLLEEQCNRTFHHLKQLLSYVFVSGLHRNPFVMSRLLYTSLIELEDCNGMENLEEFGVHVFNQIRQPNIFSWNTMIRFFGAFNDSQKNGIALQYYMRMLRLETFPDRYTFPFLLQACGASSDLNLVKQVRSHVLKFGFGHDLYVQNSLLNACLISGSAIEEALELFDEMSNKDVISWTSLISGLVSQTKCREALLVFKKLMVDDCQARPDVATVVSAVSACGNLGSVDHTKCMHALLEKAGLIELDISVVNSLIDAYAKCGNLCHAKEVFDDIQDTKRDLYSWTAIISGFAIHGRGFDSLKMFYLMEYAGGLVPDSVIFLVILSACAHSGLVKEGLCIFESMTRYQVEPNLRHYGCIIDLLGRAGMLEQAYNIVENMPISPNLAILGSLLSGCRLHNNLELGKAVSRMIEFLKDKGGSPILLSYIYANENQWNKVMHIRKEMKEIMLEKTPGRSWIVVKDAVHEFVAGNNISPQTMDLHKTLEALEKLAKLQ